MPHTTGVVGERPGVVEIPPCRLNPTDATLWDIERDPTLRTTIVAVLHLDRPVEPGRLRDALEAATRIAPWLRQRVVEGPAGIGTPHWEIDPDFDLDRHVTFVDAPDGVDPALIRTIAEPMAGSGFDRTIPLWECAYVGGTTGSAALVLKVHHSLTDGVGGVELLDALLDRDRDAPARDLAALPEPRPGRGPRSGPTDLDLGRAARSGVELPLRMTSTAVGTLAHPRRTVSGAWKGVRSAGRLLAPSSAPLSPLMTDRGADRRIGTVDLDLDRLHRAAAAHDCTVNHAFFAGAIGGLAAYHAAAGRPVEQLRVTMPVSVRRSGHDAAGNQWAPVRIVVPADIADPLDRMFAMRHLVRAARREPALSFSQSLAGVVQVLPSMLSSAVVGGMMHGVDLTLTNVPGLTDPHYLCGAEVERIHSFAPTAGAALNVALVSHVDRACIGLLSDAAAIDDPDLLRDLVAEHLEDVVSVAERRRPAIRRDESPPPTGPPERLSALDTGFLRLERPEMPMHIGGVSVLDGEPLRDADGELRLDDIRSHIEARVRRLPRFGRRISEVPLGLGRPLWVDDERFDIARHVQVATVPPPGGRRELFDLCAELFATPLDRAHPLWEFHVIDGLADGRIGLLEKVHHALVDGVSGVELTAALFDVAPDGRPESPSRPETTSGPGALRRVADAVVEQIGDPVVWARDTAGTLLTDTGRLVDRATKVAAALGEAARPSARTAPAPFNRPVGRQRVLRDAVLDRELVDRIRQPLGATVNDVVLASVAGALRRWFDDEQLTPGVVHVLVPVSTRRSNMSDEPGNRVGGVFVPLPVAEPDARRRLDLVRSRMARLKATHEGEGAAILLDALDHVPAIGYGPLVRLVAAQPFVNLVVTNVPGPRDPLYFLGARIDEMLPIVPLGPRLGLGIAVLSYTDRLTVSLLADPDACAHVDDLAAAITDELDDLAASLDG